jgi:hypothetical protein
LGQLLNTNGIIHFAAYLANVNNEVAYQPAGALMPIALFYRFHEFFTHNCLFFGGIHAARFARLLTFFS